MYFQGMEVHGIADYVICHGRVVVEEGNVRAVSGMGKFIPTPNYSPYVYGRVQERDLANAPKKVRFYLCYLFVQLYITLSIFPFYFVFIFLFIVFFFSFLFYLYIYSL